MIYESCIKNNVTDAIKNWRKVTTIRFISTETDLNRNEFFFLWFEIW